jgi:hypothetical protein
MIFKIVNPSTLLIEQSYEAEEPVQYGGSWGSYPHIPVPIEMDADCVIAHLNDDVIELVEDVTLKANKVITGKNKQIADLNIQTWSTILTQAQTVYPDVSINVNDWNMSSILIMAAHSTYEAMVTYPSEYVGEIFTDNAAVLAYAQPKLAASNAFGKWRIGILAAESAQKAIILGS